MQGYGAERLVFFIIVLYARLERLTPAFLREAPLAVGMGMWRLLGFREGRVGWRGRAERSRADWGRGGGGFRGYGVTHVSVGMWLMGDGGVRTKKGLVSPYGERGSVRSCAFIYLESCGASRSKGRKKLSVT